MEVPIAILQQKKGESDKKDSLLVIAEEVRQEQAKIIKNHEVIIDRLNDDIKRLNENCKNTSLVSNTKVSMLTDENKHLRKDRNFWRTLAIAIPTVIAGASTYILLK